MKKPKTKNLNISLSQKIIRFIKEKPFGFKQISAIIAFLSTLIGLLIGIFTIVKIISDKQKHREQQSIYQFKIAQVNFPDSIYVLKYDDFDGKNFDVVLQNNTKTEIDAILKCQLLMGNLSSKISELKVNNKFQNSKVFSLGFPGDLHELATIRNNQNIILEVSLDYQKPGEKTSPNKSDSYKKNIKLLHKNFVNFNDQGIINAFLKSPSSEFYTKMNSVVRIAEKISELKTMKRFGRNLITTITLYHWMIGQNLVRKNPGPKNLNYLQLPTETMTTKDGTPNDLAILFAQFLNILAVPCTPVAVAQNKLLLIYFNTGIRENQAHQILENPDLDPKFVDFKSNLWLPLDMRAYGESFYEIWHACDDHDLPDNISINYHNEPPIETGSGMNNLTETEQIIFASVKSELEHWPGKKLK